MPCRPPLTTSMRSTLAGADSDVGPATSVTAAPASAAACASAKPIFPELVLVIPRTGSIASNVGPAVISTRLPVRILGWAHATTAANMSSGSCILPCARLAAGLVADAGPEHDRRRRRRAGRRCADSRRSSTSGGSSPARRRARSRSQASASTTDRRRGRSRSWRGNRRRRARRQSHWRRATDRYGPCHWLRRRPTNRSAPDYPDSACIVIGVMNRHAPAVITTLTAISALTKRRVSSAALYAAMPPVSPSTIRLSGEGEVILAADTLRDARSLHCSRSLTHRRPGRAVIPAHFGN